MDKYKKLGDIIKGFGGTNNMNVIAGEVISVQGESCTVEIGGMEITDVRLKAAINNNSNKVLITPKVGSIILLASLTGDLKDLCVISVDEVEKIEYRQGQTTVNINSEANTLESDLAGTVIKMDDKIVVKNQAENLITLMLDFIDLCINEKHMTNAGVTISLNPISIINFEKLKTRFQSLLNTN